MSKDRIIELETENAKLKQALGEMGDPIFWSWEDLHIQTANSFFAYARECRDEIKAGTYQLTILNTKILEEKLKSES